MSLLQICILVLAIGCFQVKAGCENYASRRCTEHQLLHNECPEQFVPPSKQELPCGHPSNEESSSAAEWNFAVRGEPGVDFPNYKEIPRTSFSCREQKYVPGFYADMETGCQVFHVCYEHRQESFLCPEGTIFNQPLLTCDYWYSADCSQAASYYDVNAKLEQPGIVEGEVSEAKEIGVEDALVDAMISSIIDSLLSDEKKSEDDELTSSPDESEKIEEPKPQLPEVPAVTSEAKVLKLKPIIASVLKPPVLVKPKPVLPVVPVKPKPVLPVVPVKPKPVLFPIKAKPVADAVATIVKSKPIIKAKAISKTHVAPFKAFLPIKAKVVAFPILKAVASVMTPLKMAAAVPKPLVPPMKVKLAAAKSVVQHAAAAKAQLAVLPLTKKLLAASYVKLLKIHKLKTPLWGLKG